MISVLVENRLLRTFVQVRNRHVGSMKNRQLYCQYILSALLVLGVFFPTSIHGEISKLCSRSSQVVLSCLLLILLYLNGIGSRRAVWCAVLIPIVLILATLFSPLQQLALGASLYLFPISLLIILNLRGIGWSNFLDSVFFSVSFVLLGLAFLVIADVAMVDHFFQNYYARFYEELLRIMLEQNKPVIFFSSHSIAAFMFFWFFFISLIKYIRSGLFKYLCVSALFIAVMWMLKSNSSIFLVLICLVIYCVLFVHHCITKNKKTMLFVLIVSLFLSGLVFHETVASFFSVIFTFIAERMATPNAGFLGRYSSTGVLAGNIQYLTTHPFSPIGLRNGQQLWLIDSGPIEYLLRGSVVLLVAIYFGLYNFLNHNLNSKVVVWFLFVVILINELGFSYMHYFRFQYLLPFFIAYIHHLELVGPPCAIPEQV